MPPKIETHAQPFECDTWGCWFCRDNYPDDYQQSTARYLYAESYDDNEAKSIILQHAQSIQRDYTTLKDAVTKSGDAILAAWRKAGNRQKSNLLDQAQKSASITGMGNPGECLRRNETLLREEALMQPLTLPKSVTLRTRNTFRNAFLVPYLNIQTLLADETALLCLLHRRAEFPPSKWTTLDLQLSFFGRNSGLLQRSFNGLCFGIDDATYGNPVEFDYDLFHKVGHQVGFSNAQILFEAQGKLYRFLTEVVKSLLKGNAPTTGDTEWRAGADAMFLGEGSQEPPFPRDQSGIGQAVDRHISSRPASATDIATCFHELARARQQARERELGSLQTDPIYMQQRLDHLKSSDYYLNLKDDATRWSQLSLDIWTPLFRRNYVWDNIALWSELLRKNWNMEVVGVLHSIPRLIVDGEYRPLITNLLIKGKTFQNRLKANRGSKAQNTKEKTRCTGLTAAGPPVLPLPEIMQVAANAVRTNTRDQEAFEQAQVLGTIEELSAISCMISILESLPDFVSLSNDVWSQRSARYDPLLRSTEGGHYMNNQILFKDVFTEDNAKKNDSGKKTSSGKKKGPAKKNDSEKKDDSGQINDFNLACLTGAGQLLQEFLKIPVPDYSQENILLQLTNEMDGILKLNAFWGEVNARRIEYVAGNHNRHPTEISHYRDMTVMQAYKDKTHINLLGMHITAEKIKEAAKPPLEERQPRVDVPAGTFEPFAYEPPSALNRAELTEQSAKRQRDHARWEREEALRIAAGGDPTPAPTAVPPPAPITVSDTSLNVIATWWPYQSGTYGTRGPRVTWQNCVDALADAGMTQVGKRGNHRTFTGVYGSFSTPSPHEGDQARMDRQQCIWLGRACQRNLGWTWATFDPLAVPPVEGGEGAAGEVEVEGEAEQEAEVDEEGEAEEEGGEGPEVPEDGA